MSIKKNQDIYFEIPVTVTIMIDGAKEGYDFNNVESVFREEDNTVILTRSDMSKIIIPGNKYIFLEFRENQE